MTRPMSVESELDRVLGEQIAGTTFPNPVKPLPPKEAPVPEFTPREGRDL